MSVLGALIGAGGSLLGGIFGSKKPKVSEKDIATQIVGQARGAREAGEKYGFNPLALLGLPVDATAGQRNYAAFGRGIADASLMLGDALSARRAAYSETEKLRQDNAKLEERLNRLTLRAPIPGVYQRMGPNVAQPARGVPSSFPARPSGPDGAGDLRPLKSADALDPRREVQNSPIKTDAGFVVVDNPYIGEPFRVPVINDETVDMMQLPVIAGSWAVDRIWRLGSKLSLGRAPAPGDAERIARAVKQGRALLAASRVSRARRDAVRLQHPVDWYVPWFSP